MKVRVVSFVDKDDGDGFWCGESTEVYEPDSKYDYATHVIMTIEDYEDLLDNSGGSE